MCVCALSFYDIRHIESLQTSKYPELKESFSSNCSVPAIIYN